VGAPSSIGVAWCAIPKPLPSDLAQGPGFSHQHKDRKCKLQNLEDDENKKINLGGPSL